QQRVPALRVPYRTNTDKGQVAEDVLSLKNRKLAARKYLAPLPADRQVNLTHVDIRAELVMCVTCVLDLWRKAEVDAKVHSGFLAPGLERGERWEQPCAYARVLGCLGRV